MTVKINVKTPDEDKKAIETLFDNIDLIIKNKELILKTPEYYNIHISGIGIYPLYIQSLHLFIGDLLQLWEQSDWKQGEEYFYYVTGSPLSGSNFCKIWDRDKGFTSKHNPTMLALISPAFSIAETKIKSIFEHGDSSKRTPSSLTIYDLIDKLKCYEI